MSMDLFAGRGHDWIEVGGRRWCRNCNSYQVRLRGKWRDREDMLGPWPGYSPTAPDCPSPIAQNTAKSWVSVLDGS